MGCIEGPELFWYVRASHEAASLPPGTPDSVHVTYGYRDTLGVLLQCPDNKSPVIRGSH